MPVTLTLYGGISEIGGNKILLQDGDLRLFFDFGKAFGRYGAYFDGVFSVERGVRGLLDALSLGLVPPLRGLVRDDLIPCFDPQRLRKTATSLKTGRNRERTGYTLPSSEIDAFWDHWRSGGPYLDLRRDNAPPVDAVLISHAHQDHVGDLEYVDLSVPCISTCATAFISKASLDIGSGAGAPFVSPTHLSKQGMLGAERGSPSYIGRPWRFLNTVRAINTQEDPDPLQDAGSFWASSPSTIRKLQLGPFDQHPAGSILPARCGAICYWPVDHSVPGSVGYAVQTSAGPIAYTGDIRMHGKNGHLTHAFAQALAELRPTALLCEGTRLTAPNQTTEVEVHDSCLRAVERAQGQLVVADFAPRNIERLLAFADIAAQTRRTLLIQPRDAYLLRAIHLADPAAVPDVMLDERLAIYPDPKATEGKKWEKATRKRYANRILDLADIRNDPGGFILALSLPDLADLNDLQFLLRGKLGGTYIFSNSPAHDDEQRVDLQRLWRWTQHLGMRLVGLQVQGGEIVPEPGYHASGHAGQPELVELVRTINPRVLIPIHTDAPESWADLLNGSGIQITPPRYAEPISITPPG